MASGFYKAPRVLTFPLAESADMVNASRSPDDVEAWRWLARRLAVDPA